MLIAEINIWKTLVFITIIIIIIRGRNSNNYNLKANNIKIVKS